MGLIEFLDARKILREVVVQSSGVQRGDRCVGLNELPVKRLRVQGVAHLVLTFLILLLLDLNVHFERLFVTII